MGPAGELLRQLEAGRLALFVSDDILDEARDVLGRSKLRAKNPQITDQVVQETFDRLDRTAIRVATIPNVVSLPRDPDDEPYLNLAVAVAADYLVTRDNDMLDLMQDGVFRAQYPTLTILNPVALLQILTPSP